MADEITINENTNLMDYINLTELQADPVLHAFVMLLNKKVVCFGNEIPLLTRFNPEKNTPCITFSIQGGLGQQSKNIISTRSPLATDHPYYDPENPTEEYTNGYAIREEQSLRISIMVWALTPEERDCIFHQIKALIKLAQNNHYLGCYRLNTTECRVTQNTCDALSEVNRFSIQGKCPYLDIVDETDPNYRNPIGIFSAHGIKQDKIGPRAPQFLVDAAFYPEIYRVIWDLNIEYVEVDTFETMPICAYENEDTIR